MPSRKKLLHDCKLYLILDTQVNDYDTLLGIARRAVSRGVTCLQLRDKHGDAGRMCRFSERILRFAKGRALYIVNDRVDVAKATGADGVHLGQNDLPVSFARKELGKKAVIGKSCQRYAHVTEAVREGADYIGLGSVYRTKTKPERSPMDVRLLKKVFQKASVPVFAIGGIDARNLRRLKDSGVDRVAVCRSICLSRDRDGTLKEFMKVLKE